MAATLSSMNSPDYRLLFNALPGLYMALNPELVILAASDGFLHATMTRREDIVGQRLFDVFPENPGDPQAQGEDAVAASMNRVKATLAPDVMPILQFDIRRPDSEGGGYEKRYWSVTHLPALDMEGNLAYILNHSEDVTKFFLMKQDMTQKEAMHEKIRQHATNITTKIYQQSQQIAATNRKLEQINADLESFSYSASHDLRAPLRAIDGFARLLTDRLAGRADDEDKRLLGIIRSSSNRMGQLIDDLLRFARISRSPLQHSQLNMMEMAESVWKEVSQDYRGHITLKKIPSASGDASLIRQVWVNLLGNAVKYSSNTDAHITISGDSDDVGSLYHIRDNGAGFDMRHADKLFNVFQRLHHADDFPGTGIGLAIVARIINRHDGRTWAEGEPGKGACFHFSLPKRDVAQGNHPPKAADHDRPCEMNGLSSGKARLT